MPFKNQDDLEAFLRLGGQPPVLPPHLLQVCINLRLRFVKKSFKFENFILNGEKRVQNN